MRQVHFDDEYLELQPITFGGVIMRANDLLVPLDRSPSMMNLDLERDGSISKRYGYSVLQYNSTDDVPYGTTARCDGLASLVDIVNNTVHLFVAKAGTLSRRSMPNGPWLRGHNILTEDAVYCSAAAYGPSGTQAAYIVNGVDEPIIATDTDYATQWWDSSQQIATITGGAAGAAFVVATGLAHGLIDGDIVNLNDIQTDPWTYLDGRDFRVQVKDTDEFYLLDSSFVTLKVPGTGDYSTPLSAEGVVDLKFIGMARWPRGVYATPSGTPGYPPQWDDVDGDEGSHWPAGTPDWPSGITMYGSDVFIRSMAWGFREDPSRLDYSEQGAPHNYLKRDVDHATAEEALDQPGIDGGSMWVHKGDGDKLMYCCDMYNYFVAMKTRKTVIYTGYFGIDMVQNSVLHTGAVSRRSVVRVGNDIYFWSEDGPRRLSATQEYGDIITSPAAIDVMPLVRGVTAGMHEKIIGYHDIENQRVVWLYPSGGSSENSAGLVYYYTREQYAVWDGAMTQMTDVVAARSSVGGRDEFYGCDAGGTANGLVHRLQHGLTDNGANISAYYVTKWITAGSHRRLRVNMLDLMIGSRGITSGLRVWVGWDYEQVYAEADTVIASISQSTSGMWGLSRWGVDFIWGMSGTSGRRYKVEGSGQFVRFKIVDDGPSSFELAAIYPQILTMGTR